MTERTLDLHAFGWTQWFETQVNRLDGEVCARVAAIDRHMLLLADGTGSFRAKLSGSYLFHNQGRPLPCVGDWVVVVRQPGDNLALVQELLTRQTSLRRRAVGADGEEQMIAANIDCVFIVQSCHYDFNLKRLQRYLVMVGDGGAEPRVVLTKTDLVAPEVLAEQVGALAQLRLAQPILALSSVTGDGIKQLEDTLQAGKTYCFVGSSGVGKSTLINHLLGRAHLETRENSESGEGRHTTVRRELILLDNGALVIDNPGMREFGIAVGEEGIDAGFAELSRLASACRYRDCSHNGEPGCAVQAALESGELGQEYVDNYRKLKGEAEFFQLSHAEKRKKDRDFGKFLKTAKKTMRK
jgi:ribosome biogenesis GTPase / thiamine phosphate phosphatase